MKIGVFSPYLDTVSGGEKYMLTLAKCLSSLHQVSILWDKKETEIKSLAKKRLDIDITKIPFQENIFSPNVSLLQRFQASKKYDLIIFLSNGSIPVVSSKLVIHFQFPTPWVHGRSLLNRIKIARVSNIVCNSKFTKSFIDETFGVRSRVIYPPFYTKQMNDIKKENIILSVGRFGRTIEGQNFKKQDVMIEIFKKLVDKGLRHWELVFFIAVRDEDKQLFGELKKLANGYPIRFFENASNTLLWQYYASAKIYWHAAGFGEDLKEHPEYAEHFGIATVEAMSARAVPVVIDAGGQPEIVSDGDNGFLWKSEEECIEKTQKLIENKKLLTEIAEKAAGSVVKFREQRFCQEFSELVSSL